MREQVATLLNKAKSHHLRLFILLAVSTAARSGALLDLTWSQIDFKEQLIDFGRGWGNVSPRQEPRLCGLALGR
jgi:integrase